MSNRQPISTFLGIAATVVLVTSSQMMIPSVARPTKAGAAISCLLERYQLRI